MRSPEGKWHFVTDPLRQASAESKARRDRKLRAKAGKKNKPEGGQRGRGIVPIAELSPEDKLRAKLELRSKQRQVSKDGDAPTKLATLPGVHALSLATRYIDGGRDKFIEMMQIAMLNGDPMAIAWWTVFADLTPTERTLVSFDDICGASGVQPSALMALVVKTAMDFGRDVANFVAALTHPRVVEASVKSAEKIDSEIGFKDREMLFKHHQFIPLPKGMTVNLHASANAQAAAAAASEPSVPSFTDDLAAAAATKSTVQRQLTEVPAGGSVSPSPFADVVDGVAIPIE